MDQVLQTKDREWLNGLKKKIQLYADYETHFNFQDTHRCDEMGKDILHKWKPKEDRGNYAYIVQNRF